MPKSDKTCAEHRPSGVVHGVRVPWQGIRITTGGRYVTSMHQAQGCRVLRRCAESDVSSFKWLVRPQNGCCALPPGALRIHCMRATAESCRYTLLRALLSERHKTTNTTANSPACRRPSSRAFSCGNASPHRVHVSSGYCAADARRVYRPS
jgi:hypothetical protein